MSNIGWVLAGSETDPCCCSGGPDDCCLYHIEFVSVDEGPSISYSDLPTSVEVDICSEFITAPIDIFTGVYSGTWSGGTFTLTPLEVPTRYWRLEVWIGEPGDIGCVSASDCLIGTYVPDNPSPEECCLSVGVQDFFNDTYTGTYGAYDPIPLTRQSLCQWVGSGLGTEGQEYTVFLEWVDTTWKVTIQILGETYAEVKDSPQTSPVGDYNGLFTVS